MKTLFLFLKQANLDLFFFELEGDYSHLDGVILGEFGFDLDADTLSDLIYDFRGDLKVPRLEAPTRDWTYFVKVEEV